MLFRSEHQADMLRRMQGLEREAAEWRDKAQARANASEAELPRTVERQRAEIAELQRQLAARKSAAAAAAAPERRDTAKPRSDAEAAGRSGNRTAPDPRSRLDMALDQLERRIAAMEGTLGIPQDRRGAKTENAK